MFLPFVRYMNKLPATTKRLISVCSVYQEKFGFSSEDASYILQRINDLNNLSGNLIGVGNKKKLEEHLKKCGHLEDLEDLLKVHGLGPKSIKRICDKLVSVRGDVDNSHRMPTRRFRLPVVTPPLSESQASIIKTVGSVNIGTNEISWAKINCISKNIEVWGCYCLDAFTSAKKFDLITLITMCKEVVEKLPICDTYVLEDFNISGYSGSNSTSSLPRNFITTIISTLVHQPPTGGTPKVVLIGGRAVAKWSGRLVGSEKISSQTLLGDIIVKLVEDNGGSCSGKGSLPLLYAEPALRSSYLSSPAIMREALADVILLALAFIDLAVNRRETINEVNK